MKAEGREVEESTHSAGRCSAMETVRLRMRNGSLRDTCPFPLFCVHVFVCIFFFVNLDSPDDAHATRLLNALLNTYRCQGI